MELSLQNDHLFFLKYTYANSLLVSLIHLDKIQVTVVSDYGEYEWDGMIWMPTETLAASICSLEESRPEY